MIFNYKHAANLVTTWRQEALRAAPERKITFLYLANDVIQQSRRKGSHFVDEFGARPLQPNPIHMSSRAEIAHARNALKLCPFCSLFMPSTLPSWTRSQSPSRSIHRHAQGGHC